MGLGEVVGRLGTLEAYEHEERWMAYLRVVVFVGWCLEMIALLGACA